MDRFWSVSSNGFINWKGNWEGLTKGWRGHANPPIADLAGPEERAYWIEEHIPEKAWCSLEAVQEFGRIARRLFPDDARHYASADVVRRIHEYLHHVAIPNRKEQWTMVSLVRRP